MDCGQSLGSRNKNLSHCCWVHLLLPLLTLVFAMKWLSGARSQVHAQS